MIYILIFIFLIFLSFLTEIKSSPDLELFIQLLVGLVLLCFAGLRGDIEADYSSYQDIFYTSRFPYSINVGIEPGYFYLNKLFSSRGLSFQWIVILMAIFSIVPKIYFFKRYSPNFAFTVFIYYASMFFLFDFIQIRQAVTISIFMLCLPFIIERKFWPYCLCLLCASLIHVSAILLIPGYFIFNRNFNRWVLYCIVLICSLISILRVNIPIVEIILNIFPVPGFTAEKLSIYSASSTEFAPLSLKQLFFGLSFIFIKDKVKDQSKMLNVLTNLFVIGILIATLLNGLPELSFRIKWYFFWTEAILVVYMIKYIMGYRWELIFSLYVLLFIIYGYMLFSFLDELASRGNYIYPYKLFFQ